MDAVEQRLIALENEIRKLRRRIRNEEDNSGLTLDSPIQVQSLPNSRTKEVFFGYEGPNYKDIVSDFDGLSTATDPYTRVQSTVNNTDRDALLQLIAAEPDGALIQEYAEVDIVRDSGSGNMVRLIAANSSTASVYRFKPDGTITVEVNGGGETTVGGSMKVTGGGYYLIPAGPSVGTTVTSSASADTYGSWTEMRAASGNALYIVGVSLSVTTSAAYTQLDIGTGAAASETSVSETKFRSDENNDVDQTIYFPYPIAVAASTRIACRTADEDAIARNSTVTLIVVDQADVTTL